jgi:hypothetical protein
MVDIPQFEERILGGSLYLHCGASNSKAPEEALLISAMALISSPHSRSRNDGSELNAWTGGRFSDHAFPPCSRVHERWIQTSCDLEAVMVLIPGNNMCSGGYDGCRWQCVPQGSGFVS